MNSGSERRTRCDALGGAQTATVVLEVRKNYTLNHRNILIMVYHKVQFRKLSLKNSEEYLWKPHDTLTIAGLFTERNTLGRVEGEKGSLGWGSALRSADLERWFGWDREGERGTSLQMGTHSV